MKIIFPDYINCLTNITNSILKYFDIETYNNTLPTLDKILEEKKYTNIVLLLYDGMGSNLIDKHLSSHDFLKTHKIKNVHAVFPPTTTASTTSLLSGLNPCEHGWLGWDLYFKDVDETVTMFLNTKKDTNELVAMENLGRKYFPYTSIIDLINKKYEAYQLMPFGENAYQNLEDMNEKIMDLCKSDNKKFIYAYSDEPDHTMHEVGTDAKETKKLFQKINKNTEKLCQSLNNTLVIVIADHGHLNCQSITLSDYPDIFDLLKHDISIEGRACAFFVKEGKKEEFEKLFVKYFSKDFELYTKEEVIRHKFFGTGKENPKFQDSLGDYLAIAISNKYFRYNEDSIKLISMHAGITEDEVLVPLIIYDSTLKNERGDFK